MNLQNLVTDLELSKRLYEAGITKESIFWWVEKIHKFRKDTTITMEVSDHSKPSGTVFRGHVINQTPKYPALTLQELIESFIFPEDSLNFFQADSNWNVVFTDRENEFQEVFTAKTPLEALSNLTRWLLDNNYLPQKK